MSRSIPEGMSRSVPKGMSRSVPKGMSRLVPEGMSRSVPEVMSRSVPEGMNVPIMRTSKYGEPNASVLVDPTLQAGNPFKEILIKLNLPDYSFPTGGPYQTSPPCLDEIKNYIQEEQEGPVTRICHDKVINVEDNQILTREIVTVMKPWVEIIQENVFCLGGNRDHVLAYLCHMLYCIARSEQYSLAFFIAKRMEFVTKQPRLILPYGMLLTRLFKYVTFKIPKFSNVRYVVCDRVMYHLTAQQERKTQKDYGTRRGRSSTPSSSACGQPSLSHPNDNDNDGNDKGTSRASTPSPTCFVNCLTNDIPQIFSIPPDIDPNMEAFYTRQTEILNCQVQLQDEKRGGIRSIEKGIKNLLKGKKKK
ncbi:hypothetical protein Tco_0709284 [Tanacetum coccineum]